MKTKTTRLLFLLFIFSSAPISTFADNKAEKVRFDLSEPQPTMIELLDDGESYAIQITSLGCFNGRRQTVVITKDADVLTASLHDVSKILTSSDIEIFKSFEIQLRALERGGCSTVDTYVLVYGNERFQTSDGTCSWHGYRKLLEIFS